MYKIDSDRLKEFVLNFGNITRIGVATEDGDIEEVVFDMGNGKDIGLVGSFSFNDGYDDEAHVGFSEYDEAEFASAEFDYCWHNVKTGGNGR